jgi:hypothetical protein
MWGISSALHIPSQSELHPREPGRTGSSTGSSDGHSQDGLAARGLLNRILQQRSSESGDCLTLSLRKFANLIVEIARQLEGDLLIGFAAHVLETRE